MRAPTFTEAQKIVAEATNTDHSFYDGWSNEQLVNEAVRLNQVLLDCLKIGEDLEKILKVDTATEFGEVTPDDVPDNEVTIDGRSAIL